MLVLNIFFLLHSISKGQKFQLESQYELLDSSLGLGSITMTAQWEDLKGSLKITKPLSTEFYLEWNTVTGRFRYVRDVKSLAFTAFSVFFFVVTIERGGILIPTLADRPILQG